MTNNNTVLKERDIWKITTYVWTENSSLEIMKTHFA